MQADAEESVLPATGSAMKHVNVRSLFLRMGFECFDLVLLHMPATNRNLLVLLQMFDVRFFEKSLRKIGNIYKRACPNLRLGQNRALRKFAVATGPTTF